MPTSGNGNDGILPADVAAECNDGGSAQRPVADYFSPNNQLSHASSGTGQPFGGHTARLMKAPWSPTGARLKLPREDGPPLNATTDGDPQFPTRARKLPDDNDMGATGTARSAGDRAGACRPRRAEWRRFGSGRRSAAHTEPKSGRNGNARRKPPLPRPPTQSAKPCGATPSLAELAKQLAIDMTPEDACVSRSWTRTNYRCSRPVRRRRMIGRAPCCRKLHHSYRSCRRQFPSLDIPTRHLMPGSARPIGNCPVSVPMPHDVCLRTPDWLTHVFEP